jgi:hypothetical protein
MSSKVYLQNLNKSSISRHTRGAMRGKGIGAVILDNGMGGQSSYSSLDDYVSTTNVVRGSGLSGLDKIRGKMENLTVMPSKKTKNIKFTI